MHADVAVAVPTQDRKMLVVTATNQRKMDPSQLLEFFGNTDLTILAVMGGVGQAQFARAVKLGRDVYRIPWHRLEQVVGPITGAEPEVRAAAVDAAWGINPEAFYAMAEIDATIAEIRLLTRTRLSIQEKFRKPAELEFQAAVRDLEPVSEDDEAAVALKRWYADSAMIAGAKADEKELEKRINTLLKRVPIWHLLKAGVTSPLPSISGLGPSLGGSLIGEIGDIRQFRSSSALRSYGHYGLRGGNPETGEMPQFPRRQKGQVANWNDNLHRAVWLWSNGQVPMRDSIWKDAYYWFKAVELEKHPEVVVVQKEHHRTGDPRNVRTFTLGHLDRRAKRQVGSLLLEYVFDLWTTFESGKDVEQWYTDSRYPGLFTGYRADLDSGRMAFLESEITRRRQQGEPEDDDSDASDEFSA